MTYLQKYLVWAKKKDVNVKIFNLITKLNEIKTFVKHISCDCNWKCGSTTCNSNQKWNNDKCQGDFKKCGTCKKDFSWKFSTWICEKRRTMKIKRKDEQWKSLLINNCVWLNYKNTMLINVTKTVSLNHDDKKLRYNVAHYILNMFLLAVLSLLIIAINYYH